MIEGIRLGTSFVSTILYVPMARIDERCQLEGYGSDLYYYFLTYCTIIKHELDQHESCPFIVFFETFGAFRRCLGDMGLAVAPLAVHTESITVVSFVLPPYVSGSNSN